MLLRPLTRRAPHLPCPPRWPLPLGLLRRGRRAMSELPAGLEARNAEGNKYRKTYEFLVRPPRPPPRPPAARFAALDLSSGCRCVGAEEAPVQAA